jgi:hypothetical protein
MRVIGIWSHGIIDYLMVIILAIAPSVAGFNGRQATICYALAVLHFLLTVVTRFPLGVVKVLSFTLHGSVEFVVGLLVILLPWLAGFSAGLNSRNFFVAIGVLILVIWAMTDYRNIRHIDKAVRTSPPDATRPGPSSTPSSKV